MKIYEDIEVFKGAKLSEFCTFKVGGKAKLLFVVHSNSALNKVCFCCKSHKIRYKIIGFGANLLFDDNGFDGAIIVNRANKILLKGNCVYADGGVAISALIPACLNHGLGGIEKLAGIPSSVGGAVVNGLGAFGVEFNNFVEYVLCLDGAGKHVKLKNSACKFGYRTSRFKHGDFVILRVKLKLNFADKETIKSNMLSALAKKSATQPLDFPSAGSVFKRFFIDKDKIKNNNICYNDNEGNGLVGFKLEDNNEKQTISAKFYDPCCDDKKDTLINFKSCSCDKENKKPNKKTDLHNNSYKHIVKIKYGEICEVNLNDDNINLNNNCYNHNGGYWINNEINPHKDSCGQNALIEYNSNGKQLCEIVPAKIIDALGLKGLRVGGAMVSTKHAGFIINTGGASGKDISTLIEIVNAKVKEACGFTLPLEIEIVK